MAEPILRMNLEESMCLIMKCNNSITIGKAYRYIAVYLLVHSISAYIEQNTS